MKRFLLLWVFSWLVYFVQAQEKIVPDSVSISRPQLEMNGLLMEKPIILDKPLSGFGETLQPGLSLFNMPLFPESSKTFDFKRYFNNTGLTTGSFSYNGFGWSPFLLNGTTFNQGTYRLNNRFSFGGSSFGAQSIFDTPKLNPNIQNMSVKGASMFMQYKVSDHFKIETRVSVTNHSSPWEP